MGFTRKELIEFLGSLAESASGEDKAKSMQAKEEPEAGGAYGN